MKDDAHVGRANILLFLLNSTSSLFEAKYSTNVLSLAFMSASILANSGSIFANLYHSIVPGTA
jgi:hypothetical protein